MLTTSKSASVNPALHGKNAKSGTITDSSCLKINKTVHILYLVPQPTHDVRTTLYGRCNDLKTLYATHFS